MPPERGPFFWQIEAPPKPAANRDVLRFGAHVLGARCAPVLEHHDFRFGLDETSTGQGRGHNWTPALARGGSGGYIAVMTTLKIVSWNINSVRFRIEIVERFLREVSPDILCLQETKVIDGDFPAAPFRALGYNHIILHGQRMHHGVAIISRVPLVEDDRFDWQANREARHIGVRLDNGMRIENVYVPAGGDIPNRDLNPKFGQKLDFVERMTRWSEDLRVPTLLVGDFNIAPLESDVWSHKQLLDVVSHTPIEVAALDGLRASNDWVDLGRHFVPPPERLFTWWSYRAKDWLASDRGRRLDHMWATADIAANAVSHCVFEDCRNWLKPSDHIPIMTEFKV